MSKYEEFMEKTLLNKIKKCKEMYKYLPQYYGTIITINEILIKLENIYNSNDFLYNKIDDLNQLRDDINPNKIFENRFILQNNLKFCDEVNYAIAWAQDYYKGKLNKQKLLETRINHDNLFIKY